MKIGDKFKTDNPFSDAIVTVLRIEGEYVEYRYSSSKHRELVTSDYRKFFELAYPTKITIDIVWREENEYERQAYAF